MNEGWGNVGLSRKAHYFRNGISLCGKWGAPRGCHWEANQELGSAPDAGTCAACWRRRMKESVKPVKLEDLQRSEEGK